MKFFSDFFKAIGNCFKAFSVLFEKGLWPYMFIPLILWVLLWVASIYGLFILAGGLSEWLSDYVSADSIPENGHWLSWARPFLVTKISFLIGIVLKVLFWFLSGTFIKYVLLMLLSPVFALLSESAEEKLSGKKFPFSFVQLIKDIFRGVGISLRNMLLEYFFMFACFLITFIFPPLVIITTPFVLFLGWYYVGFTLLDYNSERHKFKIGQSTQFIKQNRGYACGIGFVYSFFLALPFLAGSIIGMMFGPVLAVVGGTISFLEIQNAKRLTAPLNDNL